MASLRAKNERLEKDLSDARATAVTAAVARAADSVPAGVAASGGLMAFAAQDLHRQLDAAQEQLAFKEHEVPT